MNTGPILCVDDEPANLTLLRETLKDDYSLVFALSGADSLRAVEKHQPSLILLDVQLPDIDGYTVCRQLKATPATRYIPVIFVTGQTREVDEQAGFDAGGVDYLTKPVRPAIVKARVRAHLSLVSASQLEQAYRDAIYMLGEAGHHNDLDTGMHIWRMAAYSRALAKAAGWAPEPCALLEIAAAMHDTGKIGIPTPILTKPGKLDATEWEVMKTHTRIGHEILSRSQAPVFQLAAEIALCHHERWDGSGYPRGLVGTEIPEAARIIALADVFDALSMTRPYKQPWSLEHILKRLDEGVGHHFDPRLVRLFIDILPEIQEIGRQWDALGRASADRPATERHPGPAPGSTRSD
jgi:putative two-component system response regulator